jgi:hypothetical protein
MRPRQAFYQTALLPALLDNFLPWFECRKTASDQPKKFPVNFPVKAPENSSLATRPSARFSESNPDI